MKAVICATKNTKKIKVISREWRILSNELSKIGWIVVDRKRITTNISSYFMQKYSQLPKVIFFRGLIDGSDYDLTKLVEKNIDDITKHTWIKCYYVDDFHLPRH